MSEMRPFSWSDPFLMSEILSEDERMIQDAAAAFAEAELAPRVSDAYLDETVEHCELFRVMGEAGLARRQHCRKKYRRRSAPAM